MALYSFYNNTDVDSQVVSVTLGNSSQSPAELSNNDLADLVEFLQSKGWILGNNLVCYFTPDRMTIDLM